MFGIAWNWRWLAIAAALLFVLLGGWGCTVTPMDKQFDVLAGAATQATTALKDGALSQVQVGAHANNPGVRVAVSQTWEATAQYIGFAGQIQASMSGETHELSESERMELLKIFRDSSLSAERRMELFAQWVASRLPQTMDASPEKPLE
jgi:hypothetical protein